MERGRLSEERLSGRQLSVAAVVAGLSPAAALAGEASWLWLLLWSGMGVAVAWWTLRCVGGRPLFCGVPGVILSILYKVGGAVFASRILGRAASRLEFTSGGSSRLWLLIVFAVPLLWICWGGAAPFFRTVEILWLAMAVALGIVIVFGLVRVEWAYVLEPVSMPWRSAWVACELFAPGLFLLPYIYNVEDRSAGRGSAWLAVLCLAGTMLCLITGGMLGYGAERVPNAFYVAAGVLGKSARCEGLLSALWLLPDLTLAALLCRAWGKQWWAVAGAVIALGLAALGIGERIAAESLGCALLFLWGFTLVFSARTRK